MDNNRKFAELLAEHIMNSPDSLESNETFYSIKLLDIDGIDYDKVESVMNTLTDDIYTAINKAETDLKD